MKFNKIITFIAMTIISVIIFTTNIFATEDELVLITEEPYIENNYVHISYEVKQYQSENCLTIFGVFSEYNDFSKDVVTLYPDGLERHIGTFHVKIPDDLKSDTTYYYKIYVVQSVSGQTVHSEVKSFTTPKTALFRVRKSWEDASSQVGAFANYQNAEKLAKEKGLNVYDEQGNLVFEGYVEPVVEEQTTSEPINNDVDNDSEVITTTEIKEAEKDIEENKEKTEQLKIENTKQDNTTTNKNNDKKSDLDKVKTSDMSVSDYSVFVLVMIFAAIVIMKTVKEKIKE